MDKDMSRGYRINFVSWSQRQEGEGLTDSSGKSLSVLKAANHELNSVRIIWRALENERERIVYCFKKQL